MATALRSFACNLPRVTTSFRSSICKGHHLFPHPSCSRYVLNSAAYCTKTPTSSSSATTTNKSSSSSSPWQIMSAVCVERFPVISEDLHDLPRDYQDLIDQEEYEQSYLSLHEIAVAKEMESLAQRKKGVTAENEDDIEGAGDTSALEAEDRAKAQLQAFDPASRTTEVDDLHSIERRLSDRLILLVKYKLGSDTLWVMPQGKWMEEEETLKETAERILASHCANDNLHVKILSSVPCGFYKYKYPKAVREDEGKIGAKVFFFKAKYTEGDFQLNKNLADDHMWVTRDELDQYLNQSYAHKVKKFLFPLRITEPTSSMSAEDATQDDHQQREAAS